MKKSPLLLILTTALMLIFSAQSRAEEFAPDFTYGDFGCVITSEENAEVAIYYYNEADFDSSEKTYSIPSRDTKEDFEKELKRCPERKLTFPSNVEWNGKTYNVTSLYPHSYPEVSVSPQLIVGITEVELPATLKTMPDVNPLKYFGDLFRISIADGNEYFKTEDGCLYSADGTILYAVPAYPSNVELKLSGRITNIAVDAFYNTTAFTIDLTQLQNLKPLKSSFFNKITPFTCYLYLPPTLSEFEIENLPEFLPRNYYLPSSCSVSGTGFFSSYSIIKTYSLENKNLVIRDNKFLCNNNGSRLVACDLTHIYGEVPETGAQAVPDKLELSQGIEQIEASLFSNNNLPYSLRTCIVVFPSSLKCIEDYAFEGYKGVDQRHISFGGHTDEVITEVNGTFFSRYAAGNEIKNVLPERLETLGKGCFMRSMLKEITVPNVKYIPELAFAGCKQLEKITFGKGVEQIELSALFTGVPVPNTDEIRFTPETCVIECQSMTPPQLLSTDFDTDQTFNNTVIVPDEAFEAYKEAWGDRFPNILTVSGINAVSADNTDNTEIFYNLNGQRVDGQRDTLAPGLYICRKAGSAEKIIIK